MGHLLGYAAVSTTNLLSFFVGFGALLFTAQYLQLVLGLSPLEAGLWSLPSSAGFILGSMATPLLVTGSVIFSLALAPVDTLATDLAVEAAPPERAGAASAITETSAEFGGAVGIAVLGVVGTAVYRAQMAEAVPAGVPDQAAAAARDTLGGGGGGGRPTPRAGRRGLLEVAREAFTQGLHLAAVVSAAAALAFAVLVVILLRGVRPSSQPDEQPDVAPGPGGPRQGRVEHASGAASGSGQ